MTLLGGTGPLGPDVQNMIPAASDISVLLLDSDGNHSQNVALALGGIPGLRLHVVSNLRWPAVR